MRQRFVVVATAILVVLSVTGGAMAAPDDAFEDKLSGPASQIGGFRGSIPDSAVTYDGGPGYFITYADDDDLDSLQTWADESDDREILEYDNGSNRVLLTAPPFSVNGGFGWVTTEIAGFEFSRPSLADGLVSKSYVSTIDLNLRVQYVEPVRVLVNSSSFEAPISSAAVDGRWDQSGVAYNENANRTNMSEVRSAIGAQNVSETGDGITVAVIDTGANVGDGEIYGNGTSGSSIRITAAKNFVTNDSVDISADNPDWAAVQDGNGHGSWVASAVAANVTQDEHDGVAPDANLLIAKALDDEGSGETQDIAEAIDWAEENGADVIVMSLGSPVYSATLANELEENVNNGSVTVAAVAAGNSRQTTRYMASPADSPIDGVVAVAATNTSDNASEVASAYFSSVGPDPARDLSHGATVGEGPDIAAPGMNIVAPVLSKTNGIRRNQSLSGTSMATPIVGGSFALVLERRGEWQNETDDLVEWTGDTARRLDQAGTSEVGDGLIAVDRLSDKETTDESQAATRSEAAKARDSANEAFGGNDVIAFGSGLVEGARSIVGA